jgi:hypothetical protein
MFFFQGQGGQGEQGGKEDKSKFNYSRYLQALGIAYLGFAEKVCSLRLLIGNRE